ncbi:hypothetical protein ACFW04_013632 [Cataglyphis niger]
MLYHKEWATFIVKRVDIEQFLLSPQRPLRIRDLVMEHIKLKDSSAVKLTLYDSCLYMKPSTILFLFEFEHCVNHEYLKLCENTDVSENFDQFVRCLQSIMPSAMRDNLAKILNDVYDKISVINCELLAYAVDELLHEALRRGNINKKCVKN